jgi:hypothetical protein
VARRRIKSKKKMYTENYKTMKLWDSLYTALVWVDLDRINLDWKNKKLIKKLWARHGKFIMEEWEKDPARAGHRPKIFWHIFTEEKDFKILRYEPHLNLNNEPEPVELTNGSIEHEYPIYEGETAFLKRNNLLKDFEIQELNDKKGKAHFEEETDNLPY